MCNKFRHPGDILFMRNDTVDEVVQERNRMGKWRIWTYLLYECNIMSVKNQRIYAIMIAIYQVVIQLYFSIKLY